MMTLQLLQVVILVLILTQTVNSFFVKSSRHSIREISMAGGRTKAEQGLTNRQVFQSLKTKFNEKAKIPGFFEVGEHVDLELYCKSNADGTQIGDCPFTQFIQLVLLKKGLNYNIHPTVSSKKPTWLVEKHDGKLPALLHKGNSMVESLAIAEFIEKTYPHNSLTRQGAYSYQEVLEKTNNFFPSLAAFIKNKDASKDAELQKAVESQLDLIDELLRTTPGQYLCGIELTLADLYLTPQLFHAMVALEHFKDIEFYNINCDPTRPALENYVARMFDMEEFNNKKAYYSVDQVIYGWKVARGEA